jgi:hypothetical protein
MNTVILLHPLARRAPHRLTTASRPTGDDFCIVPQTTTKSRMKRQAFTTGFALAALRDIR